jgi:hypothetical protein
MICLLVKKARNSGLFDAGFLMEVDSGCLLESPV